ncbi:hypothetical protein CC86DRAFT_401731 [Ophiobolus disseminans]|uniref:DUF6594 domain-containing protein n=1 Tax=Ophiobolus disseminans TaxID=1469910 RepID=A0A6A7ADE9_9PLEO|nr:hypothetical protein CC86DRAFT_401731 [Ophiobolus disseminans]
MSTAVPPGPHKYGALYQNIAIYPELGLFRRFGSYWAKRLHDETVVFLDLLEDVNREIINRSADLGETSILDCPLRIVKQKCPKEANQSLYDAWDKYDAGLERYGRALCMSEQIMNLPSQDSFHTKQLSEEFKLPTYKNIFDKDIFDRDEFVPTGEDAETYTDLAGEGDTCAWTSLPRTDFLTMRYIRYGKWIEKHIFCRLRRFWPFRPSKRPAKADFKIDVRFDSIVSVMDTITCLIASALLTSSVLALTWLGSLRVRVAIVGVFGTLFALLVKLLGGKVGRAEIFTATAAYFAVAVVFKNHYPQYQDVSNYQNLHLFSIGSPSQIRTRSHGKARRQHGQYCYTKQQRSAWREPRINEHRRASRSTGLWGVKQSRKPIWGELTLMLQFQLPVG